MSAPGTFQELAVREGRRVPPSSRRVVCVQGLGFVGSAMALAVASARDAVGRPCFDVVGVDLPTSEGRAKAGALNTGRLPIASMDPRMGEALATALSEGNLVATTDEEAFSLADVTVVDVPLDLCTDAAGRPSVSFDGLRAAVRAAASRMRPGGLVVLETTVPPGTCRRVLAPEIASAIQCRGLASDALYLAHAYERVMPGSAYLDSVVNIWRVYAADSVAAADACEAFLSKVVNVKDYPLTRLGSTTASETAKVMENAYRAVNIAFIEEWARFAEAAGVDLHEVVAAIRKRPTHANIRHPGFGVGGYCLTKDPLFPLAASRELFGLDGLDFPFSRQAVAVNQAMPMASLDRIRSLLGGALAGRTLLLLGVSYRQDVGDTRHSPSEAFVREARARGAFVLCHDPLVRHWAELGVPVPEGLPPPDGVDGVVLAVPHEAYRRLDLAAWAGARRPAVLDAAEVLDRGRREALRRLGFPVASIGRGEGL